MSAPTALLVDDHQIFLDGLMLVMRHDARIRVVGRAESSAAAIEAARRLQPDLVVLDVDLGEVPAETTLRRVLRASPHSRVAMLTMHNSPVLRDSLLRSGAAAFLSKTMAAASVIDKLIHTLTQPRPAPSLAEDTRPLLTRREREVLRLMSLAMSNNQIARELSISEGTVKRHASTAYLKLGATSRVDAARKAAMLGLI